MTGIFLPKTRLINWRDIAPSIHWAQHQHVCPIYGTYRRIYDYEIMYVSAGEGHVHYGEGPPDQFRSGDLMFIFSGVKHRIEIVSESGAHLMGIHFDFFSELEMLTDLDMLVREDRIDPDKYCLMPVLPSGNLLFSRRYPTVSTDIPLWMDRAIEEFSSRKPGYEMACRGYMLQILTELSRKLPGPKRTTAVEYREEIMALAHELQTRMADAWPNAVMAQRFNVSEDHFIRLFKAVLGVSPRQYLHRARHQEAQRLLRDTSMKVEQIGLLVGYDDLHNFSHVFKKWQGISPREYRKLCNMF